MQTINLYRYTRSDDGITVSTVQPDVEYTILYRLVADENMVLTDGVTTTFCVDTEDTSVWSEIADTEDTTILPEIEDNENNNDTEISAEILEKAKAYDILMGVSE